MQASKLKELASDHSRSYEAALRDKENHASRIAQKQMEATQDATKALEIIAKQRLDKGVLLGYEVEQMLAKRSTDEMGLRAELGTVEAFINTKQQEASTLCDSIAKAETELNASLRSSETYCILQSSFKEAQELATDVSANHQEIDVECAEKLAAYQTNPLYIYLVDAGFDTDAYSRRGVLRFLDRWIAGLCSFSANRQNERSLALMREMNNKAKARAHKTVSDLATQLETFTQHAKASSPLNALLEQQLCLERDISIAKKRANQIHDKLDAFASMTDDQYLKVHDTMRVLISQETEQEMMRRAKMTSSTEDDDAVTRFHEAKSRIAALEQQVKHAASQTQAAKDEYERAKRLERSIRGISDSSQYEYRSELDLTSIMTGYMLGTISEQSALKEVASYRREIEQPAYNSGYYHSSSRQSSQSKADSGNSSFSTSSSISDSGSSSFSTSDSF